MKIRIEDLTEEEVLLILEHRANNKNKKEKSFWKKYIFNKYVWYDTKQSLVRETIRAIFLLYIIERLKHIL